MSATSWVVRTMRERTGRAELSERARSLHGVMWILLAFTVILMLLG